MSSVDSPYEPFSISVVPERDQVVLVLEGEFDLESAATVEREMRGLRRAGFGDVLIDLRRVSFLDSTGLRVLLGLRNDAKREAYRLRLVPGAREVQRIFELTGTRGIFDWDER